MIIARQKRKENIAEYLLYMWQVEDLIRANKFDMDSINRTVIAHYDQPEEVKKEIAQWYEELIEMMRSEGVMEKGHIQLNKNVIITLTDLHLRLLKSPKEMVYSAAYYLLLITYYLSLESLLTKHFQQVLRHKFIVFLCITYIRKYLCQSFFLIFFYKLFIFRQ